MSSTWFLILTVAYLLPAALCFLSTITHVLCFKMGWSMRYFGDLSSRAFSRGEVVRMFIFGVIPLINILFALSACAIAVQELRYEKKITEFRNRIYRWMNQPIETVNDVRLRKLQSNTNLRNSLVSHGEMWYNSRDYKWRNN